MCISYETYETPAVEIAGGFYAGQTLVVSNRIA